MSRLKMVVGLAFTPGRDQVAMILKQSGPPCVIGNWNGVGGKMKPGESAWEAMVREFEEETGVYLPPEAWAKFATLTTVDYDLFFYEAVDERVAAVRTVEAEEIRLWPVADLLPVTNLMPNMRWMIPFLRDPDVDHDLGTLQAWRH